MAEHSPMPIDEWLEVLASVELERRTYRTRSEMFSELRNVIKAAGFIAQADEAAEELEELRANAIAEGVSSEAITPDLVEAWGAANLAGGPHRLWEWDPEQDLPTSLTSPESTLS